MENLKHMEALKRAHSCWLAILFFQSVVQDDKGNWKEEGLFLKRLEWAMDTGMIAFPCPPVNPVAKFLNITPPDNWQGTKEEVLAYAEQIIEGLKAKVQREN